MPDQSPKVVALDLGAFTADLDLKRPTAPHIWQAHRETAPEQLAYAAERLTYRDPELSQAAGRWNSLRASAAISP